MPASVPRSVVTLTTESSICMSPARPLHSKNHTKSKAATLQVRVVAPMPMALGKKWCFNISSRRSFSCNKVLWAVSRGNNSSAWASLHTRALDSARAAAATLHNTSLRTTVAVDSSQSRDNCGEESAVTQRAAATPDSDRAKRINAASRWNRATCCVYPEGTR